VYLVGDTLGGATVVEPIDRHIGASSRKLQRHCAADALLRSCDLCLPKEEADIDLPMRR
jgi:hypothetical protein